MNIELVECIDNYQVKLNKLYADVFWSFTKGNKWIYVDDELIEWLGFLKSNGKFKFNHFIKENFKEMIDYKIYNYDSLISVLNLLPGETENHKEILQYKEQLKNAHNRTTHLILSPRCFKKSIMMIKTDRANQIRDDYLDIEELCFQFSDFLINNKKNTQSIIKVIENESKIQCFNDIPLLFLAKIEDNLIKYGLTNNIVNKTTINKQIFNMFDIVYIAKCDNIRLIETILKDYATSNNKLTSRIINGTEYSTLIEIDQNFTIPMIVDKVKNACQNQYDYNTLLNDYNKLINYNLQLNNEIQTLKTQNKR